MTVFSNPPGSPLFDLSRYDDVYDAVANQDVELTDSTTTQLRPEVRQAVLGLYTHYKRQLVWDAEAGHYDHLIGLALRCKLLEERLYDHEPPLDTHRDVNPDWAAPVIASASSDRMNVDTSWRFDDVVKPIGAHSTRIDEGYVTDISASLASPSLSSGQDGSDHGVRLYPSVTATLPPPSGPSQRCVSNGSTVHDPDCDTPDCIGSPHISPRRVQEPSSSDSIEHLAADLLRQAEGLDSGYSSAIEDNRNEETQQPVLETPTPGLTLLATPYTSRTIHVTPRASRTPLGELSVNRATPSAGFSSVRSPKKRVWTPWREADHVYDAERASTVSKGQRAGAAHAGGSEMLYSWRFGEPRDAETPASTLSRRTVSRYREFFKSMKGSEDQENMAAAGDVGKVYDGQAMDVCGYAGKEPVQLGRGFGKPLVHLPKRQRMTWG